MAQSSETGGAASQEGSKISRYSPTPYTDQSWAVLASNAPTSGFALLELPAVSAQAPQINEMFEDFTRVALTGEDSRPLTSEAMSSGFGEFANPLVGSQGGVEIVPNEEDPREMQVSSVDTRRISLEEHECIVRESCEAALASARQEAQAQADARILELENRFTAITEDLKAQISESLLATEHKAADLALSVARKLIGSAAESDAGYLSPILKEAIAAAGNAQVKRIRVSPRDFEAVKSLRPDALGGCSDTPWRFEADDSIHVGCVVVTAAGEIDFDVDKAWERIRRQILSPAGVSDE